MCLNRQMLPDDVRDLTDRYLEAVDRAQAPADQPVEPDWVVWVMLGPARLHYTIATGDIIAKPDVAGYIAKEFPEWTELAARAAAHRRGEPASFTAADLLAAADHVDAVVAA
jgi:hypothetical protein